VAAVGGAAPLAGLTRDSVKTSLEATQDVANEMAHSLGLTSSCTSAIVPSRLALRPTR
jgi:hypothetical protein